MYEHEYLPDGSNEARFLMNIRDTLESVTTEEHLLKKASSFSGDPEKLLYVGITTAACISGGNQSGRSGWVKDRECSGFWNVATEPFKRF